MPTRTATDRKKRTATRSTTPVGKHFFSLSSPSLVTAAPKRLQSTGKHVQQLGGLAGRGDEPLLLLWGPSTQPRTKHPCLALHRQNATSPPPEATKSQAASKRRTQKPRQREARPGAEANARAIPPKPHSLAHHKRGKTEPQHTHIPRDKRKQ